MSKRDLPAEKAANLPRIFYTPGEVAAMTTIEYEGVLDAIRGEEIPAEKIGIRYYVPAWWVSKHLTGSQAEQPDDIEPAERAAWTSVRAIKPMK